MQCPICVKKLKSVHEDYMDNILMEEVYRCEDNHHYYSYEFLTGNTKEVINNIEFELSWSTKVTKEMVEQYNGAVNSARELYQSKAN